jgi:cyclic pyranopterin phosphate synthase
MSERVIPIAEARYPAGVPDIPEVWKPPSGLLADASGRPLHDLRISVTDRCNFRCTYCMPKSIFGPDYAFLPQRSLLSFEEIHRVAKLFVAHGVEKIRLTGGEPLLRKGLDVLVGMLSAMQTPAGNPIDLTLTTNATLLPRMAARLRDAGLKRLTISLDAIEESIFRKMNDVDFPVASVLEGIEAAQRAGFTSIKINMVVRKGVNDHQILPMATYFRGSGHILRFIEFMDVGASNGWQLDEVLPAKALIEQIDRVYPIEPLQANYSGEVAERWRYRDGAGEIGVITSVTQPFCRDCTRARLSTEGKLFTCLFASEGHDLRALLRGHYSDEQIAAAIGLIWQARDDRYSELRTDATAGLRKIEMSYIGG